MKNDVMHVALIHQNICAAGNEKAAGRRGSGSKLFWCHFFKISRLVKTAHHFCQSKFLNENPHNNADRAS
ncbi:hypothetical protein AH814_22225 [Salmonella enterica subsp. enterica serovar Rubislaw]|nr:hypothetical protein [Salmonella enterica subsp. enterica serovar Rubislaw]